MYEVQYTCMDVIVKGAISVILVIGVSYIVLVFDKKIEWGSPKFFQEFFINFNINNAFALWALIAFKYKDITFLVSFISLIFFFVGVHTRKKRNEQTNNGFWVNLMRILVIVVGIAAQYLGTYYALFE